MFINNLHARKNNDSLYTYFKFWLGFCHYLCEDKKIYRADGFHLMV